jgi:hypothetical protein
VTSTCQSNGTWYELACGPRGAELLPHRQWLEGQHTAGYERFDARIVDSFASVVQKRGEEVGASELLAPALAAAEAWFRQNDDGSDVSAFEAETEQRRKVAVWTQAMCRVMRHSDVGEYVDEGPGFSLHADGDIGAIGAHYLYETCKRYKHTVFGDVGRWAHDVGYEAIACGQDQVQCAKDERRCLGSCSGVDASSLNHDFHTIIGLTELGVFSLGEEGHAAAEANCSIKNVVLEVPAFGNDQAFATFAARLRVRSGMSAISSAWCNENPLSCGVIQRTLERVRAALRTRPSNPK